MRIYANKSVCIYLSRIIGYSANHELIHPPPALDFFTGFRRVYANFKHAHSGFPVGIIRICIKSWMETHGSHIVATATV